VCSIRLHGQADLVKARNAKPRPAAESETVTIRKATELLQNGFMSKAANRLSGNGTSDTANVAVQHQLAAKHPQITPRASEERKARALELSARVPDAPELDMEPRLRALGYRCGTGPDGFRNEFLKVLVQKYSS